MNRRQLGSHLSIGKGFSAAVDEAQRLCCSALQIFSHNASAWRMKPIDEQKARDFRQRVADAGIGFVVIHTMYLINLASPDDALYERSIAALREEVARAGVLGAQAIVTHLGAHKGAGTAAGIARVTEALNRLTSSREVLEASGVRILLENTAGAGTTIGGSFEELAQIFQGLSDSRRVGVCLDTCHAFAAGYDLRDHQSVNDAVAAWDHAVGVDRLEMVHLNDSKHPCGSRRDRHEHIGEGEIGEHGMTAIVNHPGFRDLPMILETPKTLDGRPDADSVNLGTVRALWSAREAT